MAPKHDLGLEGNCINKNATEQQQRYEKKIMNDETWTNDFQILHLDHETVGTYE